MRRKTTPVHLMLSQTAFGLIHADCFQMKSRFVALLALIPALLTIRATGETVISVDTPNDQGWGCLVIYNGQGYRVGWTQTDTYDAATVSVNLSSEGATNQTGRAYITTQIGPGTSPADEIASTPFTFPLDLTNVVLFQGLHLPPGSYYLSIIGDSSTWGSCWKIGTATNVLLGTGDSSLGGFGAAGALSVYFPATPPYSDLIIPPELTVQGINVTHPMLQIAQSNNLVLLSWSTNAVGFTLESASTLSPPSWQPITQTLITNSGSFVFTTNANGVQFFRLNKQTN